MLAPTLLRSVNYPGQETVVVLLGEGVSNTQYILHGSTDFLTSDSIRVSQEA